MIPIVDVFAGAGGLLEGFAELEGGRSSHRLFKPVLSVERDRWACETLKFRAIQRMLESRRDRLAWSRAALGDLGWGKLAQTLPTYARVAEHEVLELSLASDQETVAQVRSQMQARVSPDAGWVLVGGPPCQAYSIVGRVRNRGKRDYDPDTDTRQTLYVEYLQLLADHAPAVFVMENVKGLLSASHRDEMLFGRIVEDLQRPTEAIRREGRASSLGRSVEYVIHSVVTPDIERTPSPQDYIVRAELFGVPQRRHRVIIVGRRVDAHLRPPRSLRPSRNQENVRDAIFDLPALRSGLSRVEDSDAGWRAAIGAVRGRAWVRAVDPDTRQRVLEAIEQASEHQSLQRNATRAGTKSCTGHNTRSHIAADLERYLFTSAFGTVHGRSPVLADFPVELYPKHANVKEGVQGAMFSDRFRVQLADQPSSTITSHIAKDGHYFIHPDPAQCRSLTVREAARLQTFPDDFVFRGPRTEQYRQVGNAVPPLLAKQIAAVVAEMFGHD